MIAALASPVASSVLASIFPLFMIVAALCDATTFIIPNRLTGALALAFVPAALLAGMAPLSIGVGLIVGAVALVAAMGMFTAGWIGGGDAKLFAGAALWLGWPAVGPFLTWTAIVGGALTAALLVARKAPAPLAARGPAWVGRLLAPQGDVPYGVAIAAGALAAYPASAIWRALGLH